MNHQVAIRKVGFTLPGVISKTSWQLPPDLTFEEWLSYGAALIDIEGSVQWWLGDWWAYGEQRKWGDGPKIAERLGIAVQTLLNYGSVARSVESSRRREDLNFSQHVEVAKLTPARQDQMLERAATEHLSVNKMRSTMKRDAAVDRTRAVGFNAKRIGKRAVIYADPPWQYENPPMGGGNRSIENHYPTMTLAEICALPITEIAHDDAVLYLWATAPKLVECMQVIEAWGFLYRTNAVWVKDKIGMGYYFRNRHELLLVGKRGELPPPSPENRPDSVIDAPRTEHSEKPELYDMLDRMYPDLEKIELFTRNPDGVKPKPGGGPHWNGRPAWWAWGNQA